VALALVLLVGAGLMVKSFRHLHHVDAGFDARQLLTVVVRTGYEKGPRQTAFFDQLLPRIQALPGVESASAINHLPIDGDVWGTTYVVEGRPAPRPGHEPQAMYRIARPGYFRTMKMLLHAGRDFTDHDKPGAPLVVIVNETFARTAWSGGDAIGKRIQVNDASREIVAVVKDAKQKEWTGAPMPEIYFPDRQTPARDYLTLVVRATGEPAGLAPLVQREVWALDRNVPLPAMTTMEQAIANALWQPRFNLLLLNLFAALALILAAVGIYGVMAYSVTRRTREIGIRLALGADARQVLELVVGQGMLLTAIGVVLGLCGAAITTRMMAALLFEVSPTDPATFLVLSLVLLLVALFACWLPARRAMRIDPMVALRQE